jgi:hypothetical protein
MHHFLFFSSEELLVKQLNRPVGNWKQILPEKEMRQPQSYVDRSWENINRSQTHECGNWDGGRAIPRKGTHKWDFRCNAALRKELLCSVTCATCRNVRQPTLPVVSYPHRMNASYLFPQLWGKNSYVR